MEKKIFSTTQYDNFTFFEGNRSVDQNRIKQLMESIKINGLINPLVVSQNLEIIDGQHRYAALKILQMPIDYHIHNVDRGQLISLVRDINSVQKNWTNYDIANAYSVHSPNKIHYKRYMDLVDLGINHSAALEACGYLSVGDNEKGYSKFYKNFKNGNLEITEQVFNNVKGFVATLVQSPFEKKIWNKAHFIRALLHLHKLYKLDIKKFFRAYENNPYKWKKASTYDDHKTSMVKLYNFNNQRPIKVLFE